MLRIVYDFTAYNISCSPGYDSISQEADDYYDLSNQNSAAFENIFDFECEGDYLLTYSAADNSTISYTGTLLTIENNNPFAKIGNFPNQTYEDEKIKFTSDLTIFGSNETQNNYRFVWSFGDGNYGYDQDSIHSYCTAGVYNISLFVVDCYGNNYTDSSSITILERTPEINGPFTFYGVEGQAITLDVEVFDSFMDESNISYTWYEGAVVKSYDKKPTFVFEDGTYDYNLQVDDHESSVVSANISIIVEDSPPLVMVANHMYSGTPTPYSEGLTTSSSTETGKIKLQAFGFDTNYDLDELSFNWTVISGNNTYSYSSGEDTKSTMYFRMNTTSLIHGIVVVEDNDGFSSSATFTINVFLDSNGNGFSDEFEDRLAENGESLSTYTDSDYDGLSDAYETYNSNTLSNNSDSDGDGLYDGFNNQTGIGEITLGTNPLSNDTDSDGLSDYLEVFGWNITTELYGQVAVYSDPNSEDTDDDGLSDYTEYTLGTNPKNADTDADGLSDSIDPYPTRLDYDDDGLSDKYELDIGTSLNNSDTDGDGLSDGEEILGWAFKTDPLSADTDHDFLSDTAELISYKFTLSERVDLSESRSLWFDEHCTKAAGAQIALTIAFGEASSNFSYGIIDVPDINITITKAEENLLIFNSTTNCTRYFSEVIDFRETIENKSLDYRGEYIVSINNTNAGCLLEQFDIEVAKYLNPHVEDFDGDGIMDGVETGLLVNGTKEINAEDVYGDPITINFPIEEIGWWFLDEGDDNVAKDLSHYENNGTLTNMESEDWKAGKIGDHALEFDGTNEFINCGDDYSINIVNIWDSNAIRVNGSTEIDDGQWHFVVATYDGSNNATGVKLYIDGNLESTSIECDTLNATISTSANLTLGSRTNGDYFTGQLDDVRIYNYELSQSEVSWLNNSGLGRSEKTLNETGNPYVEQQYYLEIPYIGRVYRANLTFSINSKELPEGYGNITIRVYKEEINTTIANFQFISDFESFSQSSSFSYSNFIDITEYVDNSSISEYYGKYFIEFDINGTNTVDKFVLTEFYLNTDTFVEATSSDTEAWCTDPAKWDTDNDGWSDKYEIYDRAEPTNPLSGDTDGDGAWDSYDRDPIRDLILEISPNYGWHRNLFYWELSPLLEIVVSFSLSGSEYFFCSTMQQATEDQEHIFVWPFWHYYHYRKAYFNGSYGTTELNYYANFDDDIRVQGDSLSLNIELWHMGPKDVFGNPLWDTKILDQTEVYTLGTDMELTATETGLFGFQNEGQIEVNTFGLEKANTIAIYDNETVFNGHYQQQERMNIIQLYVNDETSLEGTPFVEGPNVIVIPTSLFLETVLNKKIQDEELNETALYADGKCEFISIERDGETEEACGEVDFTFVRFDISSEDAMDVLNLLLTCLINETTNQTGVANNYVSEKLNNTSAALMNLPNSVLGYVLWLCNYENSNQGRTPHNYGDWIIEKLYSIVNFVVGIFVAVWTALESIWESVKNYVENVLMDQLQWLAYMLWILIRAAVLILIYVILAVEIFLIVISNLIVGPILIVIAALFGKSATFGPLFIETDLFDTNFKNETTISWRYIEFFDLYFPVINDLYEINGTIVREKKNGVVDGYTEDNFYGYKDAIDSSSDAESSGTESSDAELSIDSFNVFFNYMILLCGVFPMLLFSAAGIASRQGKDDKIAIIFSISGLVAGVLGMILILTFLAQIFPVAEGADVLGPIPIPITFPLRPMELDFKAAIFGAVLACSIINILLFLVLCHGIDFQKISSNTWLNWLTWIGADTFFFVLGIINDQYVNSVGYEFFLTGTGVILSSIGILLSAILMAVNLYGKNYIKKTKSNNMHGGIMCQPPPISAKIPRIYNFFIDFMMGFLLVWMIKA
jgi:hypothetical protein